VRSLRLTTDRKIGSALLSFGVVATTLSIFYESTVLAFIGLTLAFWGCLFLLVLHSKYVKAEVMDHMSTSSLSAINQIIADSDLQGKPIYIPVPTGAYLPYHIGFTNEFVYVPRRDVGTETAVEEAFTRSPKGLRITPPGLGLANLAEKKSKLDFQKLDLDSITEILPSTITQELEMADNFEMKVNENEIHTEIRKPVCIDLCKEAARLEKICPSIGCPLSSSIACILTRVVNKPLRIERCSRRANTIRTSLSILQE